MQNPLLLRTSLRLIRNLRGVPFSTFLNDMQRARLTEELCTKICRLTDFTALYLGALSQGQLFCLSERKIIEAEHANSPQGKAVLCHKDGKLFININCGNHLELRYMDCNAVPEQAYTQLRATDEILERILPYAFDDEFGYLAPTLSDVGTGLQASVMLHLPVIKDNRGVLRTGDYLAQLGFTLQSCYGNGNEAPGAFYSLTNRLTMGLSEVQTLENLSTFAVQLARQEHLAEEQLRGGVRVAEVLRHLTGTLFTADSLTAEDAMGLLSEFRLCSSLELCHPLSNERFMKLLDQVQPATLLQDNPHCMSIRELDCCRASLLQNVLPLRADV